MKFGKADRRIMFQEQLSPTDNLGQKVETWRNRRSAWAEYTEESARETLRASKIYNDTTCTFVVRWANDITSALRIIYNGKTYKILGVIEENGRQNTLRLACQLLQ